MINSGPTKDCKHQDYRTPNHRSNPARDIMTLRRSRAYRISLILLSIACVGAAGYLGYQTFFATPSLNRNLEAAETAYNRGLAAYEAKNWKEAENRFDEAKLLADKAAQALEAQRKDGKIAEEEFKPTRAKIMWIKARALRDRAYAKAHADGKPLIEPVDTQAGETVGHRSFLVLPDAETRNEAIPALREAADLIPTSEPYRQLCQDIVRESMRVEITLSPIQWQFAERILRKAAELNPRDPRAQYFLARFEFDQPTGNAAYPNPDDRKLRGWVEAMAKKSTERVNKAKEHLKLAREAKAHYWRTTGLEAEILYWAAVTGPARKVKPEVTAQAERELDELLFTPNTGALATAARGGETTALRRNDIQAIDWIMGIALDRAVADAIRPNGSPDRVKMVARSSLDLTTKIAENPDYQPFVPDVLTQSIEVLGAAHRFLSRDNLAWSDLMARADSLIKKSPEAVKQRPKILLNLAEINFADGVTLARTNTTNNPDQAKRSEDAMKRAITQAEEALKIAEDSKAAADVLIGLHTKLAEWKFLTGVRAELIEPHLHFLRVSPSPRARVTAQFLDAVAAERQGKLDKARKLFEPLTTEKTELDIARRANLYVAQLSLVLGDPHRALQALQEVEPIFLKIEEAPPEQRVWAELAVRDLEELLGQQIRANLGIALKAAAKFMKDNPGKPIASEEVVRHEAAAEAIRKKFKPPSRAYLMGSITLIDYLVLTNRRAEAEKRLAELATEYPDNIEVLRKRALLLAKSQDPNSTELDPNGVAAADLLIQNFMRDFPNNKNGPVLYAIWLLQTKRADKAVEFLKDRSKFPAGGNVLDRLMVAALNQSGQREEAQKLLSTLPADPNVDAQILRADMTLEEADKRITDALSRYERQGQLRLAQARVRLAQGKYEEAIRGFVSAIEFTDVQAAARAMLPIAMITYAQNDPAKARELAVQLSVDMPDEPGIYQAAALAALLLEEVGTPDDKWEQVKTMHAAVNRWEAAAIKGGAKPVDAGVTKILFRLMAGDVDGARVEAAKNLALSGDKPHLATLALMVEMALTDPVNPARARELYNQMAKEDPKNRILPELDARIKAAEGKWTESAEIYEKILADMPRNAKAYLALIAVRESAKQPDAALKAARDWAAKMPEDTRATVELIRLLTQSGNKAEAVKLSDEFVSRQTAEARKKASEVKPPLPPVELEKAVDNVRAGAIMATASGFSRAKAYDEAKARAMEVRKMFPASIAPLLLLGDIAVAQKDWDTAIAYYRDIIKQSPQHFIAGNNLAWILAEIKSDPNGAMAVVEDVRRPRAGMPPVAAERLPADFLDTIGVVFIKLNRPDRYPEMRAIFEAAARRYSGDPRMYLYLAHAYESLGDKAKALENYSNAVRFAKNKNSLPEEQNQAVIQKAEAAIKRLST